MNALDVKNLQFIQRLHNDMGRTFREDDSFTCHAAILKNWKDKLSRTQYEYYNYVTLEEPVFDRLFDETKLFDEVKEIIVNEEEDCYISLNSFFIRQKKEVNLRHLNGFLLDFDYYKNPEYKHLTPEEMYRTVIEPKLSFVPSAVIDSGRGLYVLYLFSHTSCKLIGLYKVIYASFYNTFKSFGMDPNAMHITQVFRLPGSFNPKAMKPVTLLEENDTDYTLMDFATMLPYSYEEVVSYKEKKKAKRAKDVLNRTQIDPKDTERKRVIKADKTYQDLKKLIELREGACEGYREYIMFLVLEKYIWAGFDRNEALDKAVYLNEMFNKPLNDREVSVQSMPPKQGYKYTTSRQKIIQKLDITEEEMKCMSFLKTPRFAIKMKQKKQRRHTLLNRTEGQCAIYQRRQKIAQWIQEGKSFQILKELALDELKISFKTFKRDIQYIQNHLYEFVELQNYFWRMQFKGTTISSLITLLECLRGISMIEEPGG